MLDEELKLVLGVVLMDDYRIWQPLNKVESGKYLYHYTTYESALKILYFGTLRFSKLCKTNDGFEQRPKIKCYSQDQAMRILLRKAKKLFNEQQKKIRILCFCRDPEFQNEIKSEYEEMSKYLSKDRLRQNVHGRGFALPRMWAQYAENNAGVCFIFDKKLLEIQMEKSQIKFKEKKVVYTGYYTPVFIDEKEEKIIKEIFDGSKYASILSFIKNHTQFVDYNYFTKLKDWESEYEHRYLNFQEDTQPPMNLESIVEVKELFKCLCGVVLGEKISDLNKEVIRLILSSQGKKIPLKQLHYRDLTTCIIPILYE